MWQKKKKQQIVSTSTEVIPNGVSLNYSSVQIRDGHEAVLFSCHHHVVIVATATSWLPAWLCELQSGDHPHRSESHQQSQGTLSNFQMHSTHCPGSHFIEGKASLALSKVGWDKKKVGTSEPPTPQLGQNTKFFFSKNVRLKAPLTLVRFPNCHECQLGFQYP